MTASNGDHDVAAELSALALRNQKPEKKDRKFTVDLDKAVKDLQASRERDRKELEAMLPADRHVSSHEWYFRCYERLEVHRTMVNDSVRTGTFAMAIGRNYHIFKGKTVLDVGTGTGILSILAVKDGEAEKAIAIDASAMSRGAEMLIKANNLQDKIKVVRKRIEELTELPGGIDRVDIIMSEWMGYGLFNESMLDAVITARKRFLKSKGWILPDTAMLYVVGCSFRPKPKLGEADISKLSAGFGGDDERLDLSLLNSITDNCTVNRVVQRDRVVTTSAELKSVNVYYIQPDQVKVDADFSIICTCHAMFRSFVFYFDTVFDLPNPWKFTTGPESRPTHWLQTVAALPKAEEFEVWKDTKVAGNIKVQRIPALPKFWMIRISYTVTWKRKPPISSERTFYMM